VNISSILTSALSASLQSGNTDLTYQTVNAVALTINAANCSGAPNCAKLFRDNCAKTSQTCGSCYDGYTGLVGDSNTLCVSLSSVSALGTVGAVCTEDSDCLYGLCSSTSSTCIASPLSCPRQRLFR
jgi:hypothetical protein